MKEDLEYLIRILEGVNKSYEEENDTSSYATGAINARKAVIKDLKEILEKY